MRGNAACAALVAMGMAAVVACGSPARAQAVRPQATRAVQVDTVGQTLSSALTDVARRSERELLLAAPALGTRPAPRLRGRYTIDQALPLLLAGSGLTYRRTGDGAYIVYAAPLVAPAPQPEVPVALPELLVTARTQNSDIQRTENDIQPYKVWSSRDIQQAHATDIDDFLRTRATGNAQSMPDVAEAIGSNRSEVNLRGMGSNQTLILVDGRRMPSLPPPLDWTVSVLQGDLNGIALAAVDRIEVLNSTAGGIYGVGATAGAVNVVLKRDYRGADLGVTYGVSARGDATIARINGRAGFSSQDGRTRGMIFFGVDQGADLRDGDRDFTARARARRARNDPAGFALGPPSSASINILSASGAPLTLDPIYGGAALGAASTFVPLNYGGIATDGGARLLANAGKADPSLSPDAAGERRSLLTHPLTTSVIANGRHRFSRSVEVYLDGLFIQNAGRATFRGIGDPARPAILAANAPTNPFQQDILVSYPDQNLDNSMHSRTRTVRMTGGVIVELPHAWKADIDYGWGRAQLRETTPGVALTDAFYAAIRSGAPIGGGAAPNPLGGLDAFIAASAAFRYDATTYAAQTDRFGDLSLRLAGPLMDAPGGPVTVSLLAEERRESVAATIFQAAENSSGAETEVALPTLATRTRSIYAELRAPLVDRDLGHGPLRGLELQLAVRRDDNRATFNGTFYDTFEEQTSPIQPRNGLTVYTAGFKVFPLDGVMARASIASGVQAPPLDSYDLTSYYLTANLKSFPPGGSIVSILRQAYPDPKRDGTALGSERYFQLTYGAQTDIKAEHAQSVSVGVVLTPSWFERFRASIDYTHIDKRGEVLTDKTANYTYILRHEDEFPGRISRAPLTDADRAKGYVAGVVTAIDASSFNIGRTVVEAVDFQADYAVPTERLGELQFHAAATWQPKLTRRAGVNLDVVNLVGAFDGPLAWRANGGVSWSHGPLSLGLNAVYYDHYRIVASGDSPAAAATKIRQQGGERIPSQVYLDLHAARRWVLAEGRAFRSLELGFGVQNLLDHSPPVVATAKAPNFSPYGDPRLRRFEINLVGHF